MGAELGATTSMFPADERMATLPARDRPRRSGAAGRERITHLLAPDRRGRGRSREVLRPRARARSLHARAARRRPALARPRAPDLPARRRGRAIRGNALRRRDLDRADRQLHQLLLRGHEPRRRRRRAGQGARPRRRRCRCWSRRARSRCAPPSSATGRCSRSRTSAPPCSRTPAARASASGAGPSDATQAPEHDRDVVQPQLPAAQRRPADDDELHRQPRDRHRAGARRPAVVQSRCTDTLTGADGKPFRLDAAEAGARGAAARTSTAADAAYVAPPADGSGIDAERRSGERAPAAAWSRGRPGTARTFSTCRCCSRAKGKTTTDHISPAGPWLRYRGHLDKFSDNMFMGATNAFTGERRQGHERPDRRDWPAVLDDRARLQAPAASGGWSSATTTTAKAAAASTPRSRRACWAARRSSPAASRASTSPI